MNGAANQDYIDFLAAKIRLAESNGFAVEPAEINPALKDFIQSIVIWAASGGRRAIFSSFGLHKTSLQLELARLARAKTGAVPLIVLPLGVRQEFMDEAALWFHGDYAVRPVFVRTTAEIEKGESSSPTPAAADHPGVCGRPANPPIIYLTNYESVREGKIDPSRIGFVSLDEAAVLRGFGGTKTFRAFMRHFPDVPYRFVATATPDPNEFIELLAYAAFLDVMDVGEAKTRFFKRDSANADRLTIHPHKEREFWLWVASWALFLRRPSDLGFSDAGYVRPPLDVRWHELPSDHRAAGAERDGQNRMFRDAAVGVTDAAREKRDSLPARVAKLAELRAEVPGAHRIIWHDLEAERRAIQAAASGAGAIYGSQDLEENERVALDFKHGRLAELATKPQMSGAGCNFQAHCHWAIYLGIGHKFHDFIQSVHRLDRFGQSWPVRLDLIYTEAEREIRRNLEAKWHRHEAQAETMSRIIAEFGLSRAALDRALGRSIGVERAEASGEGWQLVNNDSVAETRAMAGDSADLIVTSIPFATQYEYTPSYNDFGHTDDNAHFWQQMDFLTPELLRVLRPGRRCCIHVKDRIVPGGMTGLGFQTVAPFHAEAIVHYRRYGFAYLGMVTVTTDVVRENNQTYRLGWTEQCKDGTRMGVGMPEYILLFRKPPSDSSNGYADEPVAKAKPLCDDHGAPAPFDTRTNWKKPVPGTGYSRARWQMDAHGYWRSSGDRLLSMAEMAGLAHDEIYKAWRARSLAGAYDYRGHVEVAEQIDHMERLPATFMLVPPHSPDPAVWSDVARMRTLNGAQSAAGREMHLCLARGSRVLTRERGYVPIEDVRVGEHALTHLGRWRPIEAVANTGVQPVVTIRAQGVPGLTLTPDHQLWLRQSDWVRERDGAERADPEWVETRAALGGYVNQKVPPVDDADVPGDDRTWWIVGRWLADGHFDARGGIHISCGQDEAAELRAWLGELAGFTGEAGSTVQVRVRTRGTPLRSILDRCGAGAAGKHLPPEAYSLGGSRAEALLSGYLSGDGHFLADRQRWTASSVSRDLLLGVAMLAQRVHGAVATVYAGRPARPAEIEGRSVSCRQEWILSFDLPADRRKHPFVIEDGAWKKVRELASAGEAETWCLRVAEDASFTAEGCIVKNCPLQFDIVDRLIEQLTMPGETVLDPFSGIGTVAYCAVKLGRRAIGIELNPGYHRDAILYCREAEARAAVPTLFDLIDSETGTHAEPTETQGPPRDRSAQGPAVGTAGGADPRALAKGAA